MSDDALAPDAATNSKQTEELAMLSRRSILRALGFGAPAAAVAAAVGIEGAYANELRAAADRAMAGYAYGVVTASPVNVGGLSAINAKMGNVTAGRIRIRAGDLKPHTVIDFDRGFLSIRS